MAKVKLYDDPPDGRHKASWVELDEVILVLIDNPGKWAIIDSWPDTNKKPRSTTKYKARYGLGFKFTTHRNTETSMIEVWASYHGEDD